MKQLVILIVLVFAQLGHATCIDAVKPSAPMVSESSLYKINRLKYQLDQLAINVMTKKYEAAALEQNDVVVLLLELREDVSLRALFADFDNSYALALNSMGDVRNILKALKAEGQSIPPAIFQSWLKKFRTKTRVVRTEMKPILDFADKAPEALLFGSAR